MEYALWRMRPRCVCDFSRMTGASTCAILRMKTGATGRVTSGLTSVGKAFRLREMLRASIVASVRLLCSVVPEKGLRVCRM
jgi:hypothetical protein